MSTELPSYFSQSSEFIRSRQMGLGVVALESTVITHGLPFPDNLQLARDMEGEVRAVGAVPATIGVVDGRVVIGLNDAQLERLARGGAEMRKISSRDLGPAVAQSASGGTTVAGTMAAAYAAGIKVFATGGIGGVHRGSQFDISADLTELSRIPMIVVCAGAKAILDLPATLEVLETNGVPVVGYGTDIFPAFYSLSSGLKVSACTDRAEDVVRIAESHWSIGQPSAVLVTVPPPVETAIEGEAVEEAIEQALREAEEGNIHGQAVTPYLLGRVSELTQGASLRANLALLKNNARVAAEIARYVK